MGTHFANVDGMSYFFFKWKMISQTVYYGNWMLYYVPFEIESWLLFPSCYICLVLASQTNVLVFMAICLSWKSSFQFNGIFWPKYDCLALLFAMFWCYCLIVSSSKDITFFFLPICVYICSIFCYYVFPW